MLHPPTLALRQNSSNVQHQQSTNFANVITCFTFYYQVPRYGGDRKNLALKNLGTPPSVSRGIYKRSHWLLVEFTRSRLPNVQATWSQLAHNRPMVQITTRSE